MTILHNLRLHKITKNNQQIQVCNKSIPRVTASYVNIFMPNKEVKLSANKLYGMITLNHANS